MTIQRILVPVDYSEPSAKALRLALELAEHLHADVDVMHAWDKPSYITESMMSHQADQSTAPLLEQIGATAEADLAEFLGGVAVPAGVSLSHRLLSGEPGTQILRALREKTYDLVVMGTHGRSGLGHLLMGSVAERIVRLSHVPVLTVPREQ
jgi:nucleotide-binding universal stress UspA family protein